MPGWEGGCCFRKCGQGRAFNEVTCEQRLRGREEGASHGSIWVGGAPLGEGPERGKPWPCPRYERDVREADMTGAESTRGEGWRR